MSCKPYFFAHLDFKGVFSYDLNLLIPPLAPVLISIVQKSGSIAHFNLNVTAGCCLLYPLTLKRHHLPYRLLTGMPSAHQAFQASNSTKFLKDGKISFRIVKDSAL